MAAIGSLIVLLSGSNMGGVLAGLVIKSFGAIPTYAMAAMLAEALDHIERQSHYRADGFSAAVRSIPVKAEVAGVRGGCVHHDSGILDAATYAESECRRMRVLKENGFNAIRSSHNPASKALLDACDEIGMYVMDETFDM